MSLRAKLLLLALSTLVLPLSGWWLTRQFEALLREGQAQVQMASAQMLARAVARQAQVFPTAGPALFVQRAEMPLALDGYDGDWRAQDLVAQSPTQGLLVTLALHGHALHLHADVVDATRVRADANWPQAARADQLLLVIEDEHGVHHLRLASAAPGPLIVETLHGNQAPRLRGEWQEDLRGYRVELRFPVGYMPQRLGVDVLDFTDPALPPQRRGTGADLDEGRWAVQQAPADLQALLTQLVPDGVQATLTQSDGWILARAGGFPEALTQVQASAWRRLLYRMLTPAFPASSPPHAAGVQVDTPELWQALSDRAALTWYGLDHGRGLMLATAVPIHIDGQVRGALLLERPSEALLLSGQAVTGLMLATIVAMSAVGLMLFAFAGRLSTRIRTLSRAAERAIAREGRDAHEGFVASRAGDELGDLSRSFGRLLEEVGAYSEYLRGLAGTLSHELHTPIAVVRSSLENLESEPVSEAALTYVQRARAGVDRLGAIVRAMSEASRMERAIAAAEGENVDLRALIADCAEGYRGLLAPRSLQTMLPSQPVPFHGAPDLIVQALDKLVDNARSFCPPDGWVLIALAKTGYGVEIAVANAGPSLPETMQDRLFDSLVSLRSTAQRGDGAPHLGFGLHVVRLIAQRHDGHARAGNLPQGGGVEFRLVLRGMTRRE